MVSDGDTHTQVHLSLQKQFDGLTTDVAVLSERVGGLADKVDGLIELIKRELPGLRDLVASRPSLEVVSAIASEDSWNGHAGDYQFHPSMYALSETLELAY